MLPRPLDPSAEAPDPPPELEELDEEDFDAELPPDDPPRRLVAAAKREDELVAEPADDLPDELELELGVEEPDEEPLDEEPLDGEPPPPPPPPPESRPNPPRLPIRRGVMSEA